MVYAIRKETESINDLIHYVEKRLSYTTEKMLTDFRDDIGTDEDVIELQALSAANIAIMNVYRKKLNTIKNNHIRWRKGITSGRVVFCSEGEAED